MLPPSGPKPASNHRRSQPPSAAAAAPPADVVESNRSLLNPLDGQVLMGRTAATVTEATTVAEWMLETMGIDVNRPLLEELHKFTRTQLGNASPMDKMANIANGANLRPGAGAVAERALGRAGRSSAGAGPAGGGLDGLLRRFDG